MIKGTTPVHIFTTNLQESELASVMVIYAQGGKELFRKCTEQCEIHSNKVSVKLTQEETLMLDCNQHVQIQLRVLTKDRTAMASRVYIVDVYDCLNDEVLS